MGKKLKTVLLTLLCAFFSWSAMATDITPISNAFKSGDISLLENYLDSQVDISIPDISKKCDAKEALSILEGFFKANQFKSFTVVHNADRQNRGFFVGKLIAEAKEFRLNVTYKTEDNKAIIQSIRIE